jgi:DNA-directed RNA polymerase subunit RPC12/RpoP
MITEWGNCSRCGKEITDNIIGEIIEAEEVPVCDRCAEKHRLYIISELNKFRQGKEFNDKLPLRKKILWSSEQLGNWFDAGDKSYIERVFDYDNYNLFELQVTLLDTLQTLLENYIYPNGLEEDLDEAIIRNPDMEKLRLEVREQQGRIASYIDTQEFMKK